MATLNARDIDTIGSKPSSGVSASHLKKFATTVAATLALVGAEVSEAGIVTLPIGVDSMILSGTVYGSTQKGGPGVYNFFNENGIEFTGESSLGTPTAGEVYALIINAMRETGEKFDMVMNFGNLQFINDQSFEATGSNSLQGINTPSQNIPWVYAYWDKTNGIGEATINYGNATITSAVPEPGTTALLLAGLAGVAGVVAARRRRNTLGAQTPGTDTTPTPEGATAE